MEQEKNRFEFFKKDSPFFKKKKKTAFFKKKDTQKKTALNFLKKTLHCQIRKARPHLHTRKQFRKERENISRVLPCQLFKTNLFQET